MAVPPAPSLVEVRTSDADTEPAPPSTRTPSRQGRLRVLLLGVLVLLLLASTGAVVWLLSERRGEADDLQREREEVMGQARQFMLRGQTYGPEQLDEAGRLTEYRALVEEVVTPAFFTRFEETVTVAEQLVNQSGVERSVEVLGVGVDAIDDDSATVLVAGEITTTMNGANGKPTTPAHDLFRVAVDLVEVDGTWLVDDFEPVTEAAQ